MDIERPITRWRRENRPQSKSQIENERPSSRRSNVNSGDTVVEKTRIIVKPHSKPSYSSGSGFRLSPAGMQPERTSMLVHSRRERPISQQGLGGIRTSTGKGVNSRHIQDQRYFQGLLKVKMNQLVSEMANLRKQIDVYSRERAAFLIYDKRVKETAAELTAVQRKLGNFNLAMDKINIGTDILIILQEAKELAAINNAEVAAVEHLFADRKNCEETVIQLESHLEKERQKADELVADMAPQMKEQYNKGISRKFEFENEMELLKSQLKSLTNTKCLLNKQLSLSPVKAEVIRLEMRLQGLKTKINRQIKNKKNDISPSTERESLLAKVKNDNINIVSMERAIKEVKECTKQAYEILLQKQHAPDNPPSAFNYSELHNRQKSIESYLSSAEISKKEVMCKLSVVETEIVGLLKVLSLKLIILPTAADYKSLALEGPKFKCDILNTVKSLTDERNSLSLYLCKIEIMDKEVKLELSNLKNKLSKISIEIATFSDLEALHNNVKKKETKLVSIRQRLQENRPQMVATLRDTIAKYNSLQQNLLENGRNAQLLYFEKKLSVIEQNNFSLLDYLAPNFLKKNIDAICTQLFTIQRRLNEYIKNNVAD